MKAEYLAFIILSAFLHASYNLMMRRSGGSRVYLALIFCIAGIVSILPFSFSLSIDEIPIRNIIFVYAASLFYTLYQLFVSKAYERGNMSVNYPLSVLSPVFIPVWAFFFLGEILPFISVAGIMIAVAGAIFVKIDAFSRLEFKKIFNFHEDYRSARYALLASLMYSFGAIFDKARIETFNLSVYMFLILVFMAINLIIYVLIFDEEDVPAYARLYWKSILIGGIGVFLSFYTFRMALQHVFVSIAVPARLTSIIFAILLGTLVLKEKMLRAKLIGVMLIIAGVVIISLWSR